MSVLRSDSENGVRRHTPPPDAAHVPKAGEELAQECLRVANDLGFHRAGVASLEPLSEGKRRLSNFVREGLHGEMEYLIPPTDPSAPQRHAPRSLWPEAESAICVALSYPTPHLTQLRRGRDAEPLGKPIDPALVGVVAHYARGTDYHIVLKERLLRLADEVALAAGRPIQSRLSVDTAPVLERDLALRAGFAFLGKNTLCIAPGAGSHFLLGELFLDVQLPASQVRAPDGCGSCRACLDACPTGAFIDAYRLDARRCISYLTIESKADIPQDLRPLLGLHVFGCDICQSVCPYNAGKGQPADQEFEPREALRAPDLIRLLTLTSSQHRKLVARTALRRASRDQLARNAALALGNAGSPLAVAPLLHAARGHRSAQVRRHAAWSLGRLAGFFGLTEAKEALRSLQDEAPAEIWAEALSGQG